MADDLLKKLAEIQNQGKHALAEPGVAEKSTNIISATEPPDNLEINKDVPEDQLQTQQDQIEIAQMLDPRSDNYDPEKASERERERFPERYIDNTGAQPEDQLGRIGPEIGRMILPNPKVKNEITETDQDGIRELKTEKGSAIKFREPDLKGGMVIQTRSAHEFTVEGDMQEQKETVLEAIQSIQREFGNEGNIPLWHPYWGLKNKYRSYPETPISQASTERRIGERRAGDDTEEDINQPNQNRSVDEVLRTTRPNAG